MSSRAGSDAPKSAVELLDQDPPQGAPGRPGDRHRAQDIGRLDVRRVPGGLRDLGDDSLGPLRVGLALEMRDAWEELSDEVERRVAVAGRHHAAVKTLDRADTDHAVAVLERDVGDADDARGSKDLGGRAKLACQRRARIMTGRHE